MNHNHKVKKNERIRTINMLLVTALVIIVSQGFLWQADKDGHSGCTGIIRSQVSSLAIKIAGQVRYAG